MKTIQKNCVFCNKTFFPPLAEVKRGRGLVCSKECRYKRHSKLLIGHKMKPEAKKALIKALKNHVRTKLHSKNISKGLLGKYTGNLNFNWRGGMYKSQGRIFIRIPNHPSKYQNGYILNARYIVEQIIGRYLTDIEEIHHLNFKKDDDRPENLYIFPTGADHTAYHQLLKTNKVKLITESNLPNYQ